MAEGSESSKNFLAEDWHQLVFLLNVGRLFQQRFLHLHIRDMQMAAACDFDCDLTALDVRDASGEMEKRNTGLVWVIRRAGDPRPLATIV